MANSNAEYAAEAKKKMDSADVNGDNAIDMDEFLTVHENNEKSSELFSKIDSNSDGGLTQDELKSFGDDMRDNMNMMMSDAMGKMAGMRGQGGPGGPGSAGGRGGKGGPPPKGEGIGQETIDISTLQDMLSAYESDDTENGEITVEALFENYLNVLETAEDDQTVSSTEAAVI